MVPPVAMTATTGLIGAIFTFLSLAAGSGPINKMAPEMTRAVRNDEKNGVVPPFSPFW
jgi:hypothetical protein